MKNCTLLKCLLALTEGGLYKVARETGLSPSGISRTSNGLISPRMSLQLLAKYYTTALGTEVDGDALLWAVNPRLFLAAALHARSAELRGAAK